ncbi:uncharacterized protein LOC109863143 [Pseudomyrmex gracilis]|uniref:uncharacterized protein LOC109863143 n=1 Tax=Pseudomyrmex gracilis TaxID=219809 RepID=UPI000995A764|nr:uncharacterized protein LOC109863143 [Pseudomyrmex gracilis]
MYSTRYACRVELLQESVADNILQETFASAKRQARQHLLLDWEHLDESRAAIQEVVVVVRPYLEVWLENVVGHFTYRVTQVLTGHGCFGEYLSRIKRSRRQCHQSGAASDSVEHTVKECPRWAKDRRALVDAIGPDLSLEGLMQVLASGDKDRREAVISFCSIVM